MLKSSRVVANFARQTSHVDSVSEFKKLLLPTISLLYLCGIIQMPGKVDKTGLTKLAGREHKFATVHQREKRIWLFFIALVLSSRMT